MRSGKDAWTSGRREKGEQPPIACVDNREVSLSFPSIQLARVLVARLQTVGVQAAIAQIKMRMFS